MLEREAAMENVVNAARRRRVRTHTHTQTRTHTHTYTHTNMHTNTHTNMHTNTHMPIGVRAHACVAARAVRCCMEVGVSFSVAKRAWTMHARGVRCVHICACIGGFAGWGGGGEVDEREVDKGEVDEGERDLDRNISPKCWHDDRAKRLSLSQVSVHMWAGWGHVAVHVGGASAPVRRHCVERNVSRRRCGSSVPTRRSKVRSI